MGSAAAKPTQRPAAFSATISQNISYPPQTRSSNTHRQQDRQPTIPKGTTSGNRSASSQSYLSLGETSEETMVCESCSANFTIFKRKSRCLDCSKLFCPNCIRKEPRKCCKTCHMFSGSKDRSQLMQIKVKDLRQYLAARDISTITCREKEELVDLVVHYLSTQNGGAFMITVNNLDDMSNPPRATSQPETSQGQSSSTDLPSTTAPVSESIPNQMQESLGEADTHITRNTWAEGSNTSESDAEPNVINTGEEPSTTAPPEQPQKAPVRHRTSISDLTTIDDISDLTVRQLKEILTLNFINYKGCVERWELEERVIRLYNEKQTFKNKEQTSSSANKDSNAPKAAACESEEDNICKICMDSPIDCVLLECGHMVTCTKCGKQLAECPMCRQYIVRTVHVFRS